MPVLAIQTFIIAMFFVIPDLEKKKKEKFSV